MFMNVNIILSGLVMALALTGCGGGGGSTSTLTTTPSVVNTCANGAADYPTCTPPVIASTAWEVAVTSVPTPIYTGENLAAFTLLNQLRAAAGSGLLAQNAQLDVAAANHANYLLKNWSNATLADFHHEVAGATGYTGITPQTRQAFAGYTGGGMEDGLPALATSTGTECVHVLVENAVYHRLSMLSGDIDVGVSVANDGTNGVCVMELGVSALLGGFNNWGGQIPAAPVVYPYKGQTGVDTTFYPVSETPNPAPDLGSAAAGTPITVSLATQALIGADLAGFVASDVTITAFSLTAQGSTTPVNARIVVKSGVLAGAGVTLTSDVSGGYLSQAFDFLLPLAPLTLNTTYNVVFTATVKGKPVNLSWSFTTGAV